MNTSRNNYDSIETMIFEEGLRIRSVEIISRPRTMMISLNNNHKFKVRVAFYKGLKSARVADLRNFNFIADGTGIHWPDLDEDLSLKGFLQDFLRQKINTEDQLVIA